MPIIPGLFMCKKKAVPSGSMAISYRVFPIF